MKIVCAFLLPVCFFVGCSTAAPTLLPSTSLYRSGPTMVPNVLDASKGVHPFLGLGYGAMGFDSFLSHERISDLMVGTGFVAHPELSEKKVHPFVSVSGLFSWSQIDVSSCGYGDSAADAYDMESIRTGCNLEGTVSPGLSLNSSGSSLSLYAFGGMKYEFGEYLAFRRDIDGTANIYNMCDSPLTVASGFGLDVHYKVNELTIIGNACEVSNAFNQTSSYFVYDEQAEKSLTKEDGDRYRKGLIKLEPYIDYRNFRLAYAFYVNGDSYVSVTYRF